MQSFSDFNDLVDALHSTLKSGNRAIVSAPPGAGKTTYIPPALLNTSWRKEGQVLVLEPRRIAARSAASFMAKQRGERVGQSIGYRVRLDNKVSRDTSLAVLTEGIFLRQILSDPSLEGVSVVIFDEFHERSLDADLSLALSLESQEALRPDLKIIVMSATLDVEKLSKLLGTPPVFSLDHRPYPIDTRYMGRDQGQRIEAQMARTVIKALQEQDGSILAFLPGQAEIRRTQKLLEDGVRDASVILTPLYGGLDPNAQDAAIAPARDGCRKVVLSTAIAQTSLTIEGVRIVIDSGLSRVSRYDPNTGLSHLVTERVSRATAEQRRGRAGRLGPGVCYRLWHEEEDKALRPHDTPEVMTADLAPLGLALADWGVDRPEKLRWIDPPPQATFDQAVALLQDLDAVDPAGRLTEMGRKLASLPLHPRLGHMIIAAAAHGSAQKAAMVAAMLNDGSHRNMVDAEEQFQRFMRDKSHYGKSARSQAQGWSAPFEQKGDDNILSIGACISLAYPDRIAMARKDKPGQFLLTNGRGAFVDEMSSLAREPFLAVANISGGQEKARILSAATLSQDMLETLHGHHVKDVREAYFNEASQSVKTYQRKRLYAVILKEQLVANDPDQSASVLTAAIMKQGLSALPWSKAMQQWRSRLAFLHASNANHWPDLSDEVLTDRADEWLEPILFGCNAIRDIDAGALSEAVQSLLPWPLRKAMEDEAPRHFHAPTGARHPIDYGDEKGPFVALRVQELFGQTHHPSVAGQPLTLVLLSPAGRPIQITRDLPGFWDGSYAQVRADMRGRYPKHAWPEDPRHELPTRRAKPRG